MYSLTQKQINDIASGKLTVDELANQLLLKYPSAILAKEFAKCLIEKNGGTYSPKIPITKAQATLLSNAFTVIEDIPVKHRKKRAPVYFSPEEIEYKQAYMREVTVPCKGKTPTEKAAIKKAADKKLSSLKAAAIKAMEARHSK